jgi:predicted PurR-regulated permease PerM
MQVYVGEKRMQRIALVLGVTDSSFHNFIVRQSIEALILGTVGALALLVLRFRYALGIGALMGIVALVPIVGYPVGLVLGAFIVAINSPWVAVAFVGAVALAQMLEATFLLPYVGDPRTVLPPVWVTVAVTIGGGVAGFVGMLVAIPVAATIRQLTLMDVSRRMREAGLSDDSDV